MLFYAAFMMNACALWTRKGDYLWHDVFRLCKVVKTNAQDMMIDLGIDPQERKSDCNVRV